MKINKIVCLLVLVAILFPGCASTGLEEKDYLNRLGKVELGMSKSEFKQIFPESVRRRAKHYPKGTVEVLEVAYEYYSFFPTGNPKSNPWTSMEEQPQWFYFYNGKLLQYGNPKDWPPDPDVIIEQPKR